MFRNGTFGEVSEIMRISGIVDCEVPYDAGACWSMSKSCSDVVRCSHHALQQLNLVSEGRKYTPTALTPFSMMAVVCSPVKLWMVVMRGP
jgi:hypothetical protein